MKRFYKLLKMGRLMVISNPERCEVFRKLERIISIKDKNSYNKKKNWTEEQV